MSILREVSNGVKQVAEAISIALGVEVEIVDSDLTILAGTGIYASRIGQKEEGGHLDGDYLYARVFRSGVTEFVEDAVRDEDYDDMGSAGTISGELAEICTPIKVGNKIIGIIGLIAFTEEQKRILLDQNRSLVTFVEKLADLLAAKAAQKELLEDAEETMNEISTILETTHEGIFALNKMGYIKQCNNMAAALFKTTKADVIGRHISEFMAGTPAIEVIDTGRGYTENEEIFKNERGQWHFIVTAKPFMSGDEISGVVISFRDIKEAQKLVYNINTRALKNTFDDIVGNSESIKRAKKQAMITAGGNSTVLITGESGTGKEMFAKAIHYAGSRSEGPFVTVNCGAIPSHMLEGELFGYENEAVGGVDVKGRPGKFELASGGTIFLDEIGEIPMHVQVRIMDFLQNMQVERIGGSKSVVVDVRVIAATNRDLESMVRENAFREDFFFKLSVVPINLPPLRERRNDIKVLMYHFLKKYNNFMNKKITGFSKEVEMLYMNHEWSGNIRELENAIEYGINMAFGDTIGIDEVPARLLRGNDDFIGFQDSDLPLSEQIKRFEREIITRKLKKYGSSGAAKDTIAKELGLSRATLYRKLAELEIIS